MRGGSEKQMMTGYKVTTDNHIQEVTFEPTEEMPLFMLIHEQLNGFMEIVRPRQKEFPKGIVMLVDEDAEHRAGLMRLDRDAGFLGLLEPAEQELLRLERQHAAVVRLARLRLCCDDLERLDAGRHRERIA